MTDLTEGPTPTAAVVVVAPDRSPDLAAEHLPCGRPTSPLLELVLDGRAAPPHDERDDHQRTCPHCLALAAEAERLWAPVRSSARDLERPPPELVGAVMGRVLALGRRGGRVVLPGGRGETRVAGDVLRRVAERTAAGVPGVAVALARDVEVAGDDPAGPVRLALSLVVEHGPVLPVLAAAVRADVVAALAALVGVEGVRVDVRVDDVVV